MTLLIERGEDLRYREAAEAPAPTTHRPHRLVLTAAVVAIVVGAGSLIGGLAGGVYTYQQAVAQDVTTPGDAVLSEVPVRGPLSMWAQQDIITHHQLDRTEGLYYSQMERMVPQLDEAGEPVLDEAGEAVMVPNEARASWLDATALTTALGLGMMAYAVSAFAVVVGLTLTLLGVAVLRLREQLVAEV